MTGGSAREIYADSQGSSQGLRPFPAILRHREPCPVVPQRELRLRRACRPLQRASNLRPSILLLRSPLAAMTARGDPHRQGSKNCKAAKAERGAFPRLRLAPSQGSKKNPSKGIQMTKLPKLLNKMTHYKISWFEGEVL